MSWRQFPYYQSQVKFPYGIFLTTSRFKLHGGSSDEWNSGLFSEVSLIYYLCLLVLLFVFYAEIGILPRVFIRQQTLKSFLGLISAYMFILLKLHNFKYLIFPIFSFNFGGSVLHCCALNSIHPRD